MNRTAANQIVPAEKKLCDSAEEHGRVNSDGALGKMIPQIIIFGYKDDAVSTKNGLQLAKHAEANYRRRRNNFQLCSTFEAAQRTVSRG